MESQQLCFEIHPSALDKLALILQNENIPFTFEYKQVKGPAGCFQVKVERPASQSFPLGILLEASNALLKQDKTDIDRMMDIDLDYEKIRSDMKALIFYASLSEPAYKTTEKRKNVFLLLNSNLSRKLAPRSKRHEL